MRRFGKSSKHKKSFDASNSNKSTKNNRSEKTENEKKPNDKQNEAEDLQRQPHKQKGDASKQEEPKGKSSGRLGRNRVEKILSDIDAARDRARQNSGFKDSDGIFMFFTKELRRAQMNNRLIDGAKAETHDALLRGLCKGANMCYATLALYKALEGGENKNAVGATWATLYSDTPEAQILENNEKEQLLYENMAIAKIAEGLGLNGIDTAHDLGNQLRQDPNAKTDIKKRFSEMAHSAVEDKNFKRNLEQLKSMIKNMRELATTPEKSTAEVLDAMVANGASLSNEQKVLLSKELDKFHQVVIERGEVPYSQLLKNLRDSGKFTERELAVLDRSINNLNKAGGEYAVANAAYYANLAQKKDDLAKMGELASNPAKIDELIAKGDYVTLSRIGDYASINNQGFVDLVKEKSSGLFGIDKEATRSYMQDGLNTNLINLKIAAKALDFAEGNESKVRDISGLAKAQSVAEMENIKNTDAFAIKRGRTTTIHTDKQGRVIGESSFQYASIQSVIGKGCADSLVSGAMRPQEIEKIMRAYEKEGLADYTLKHGFAQIRQNNDMISASIKHNKSAAELGALFNGISDRAQEGSRAIDELKEHANSSYMGADFYENVRDTVEFAREVGATKPKINEEQKNTNTLKM